MTSTIVLLRTADFAHALRTEHFDVLAQRRGGAGRHVLVDALQELFVRGLERERELFAFDFLEDPLDRTVVEVDDVFEDEEQVLDFGGDLRIALGEAVEDVLLRVAVDEAHELRERLHAAGFGEVAAGDQQPAAEQLVELLEDFRRGLLQDRDAHRDVGLQLGHRAARARRRPDRAPCRRG